MLPAEETIKKLEQELKEHAAVLEQLRTLNKTHLKQVDELQAALDVVRSSNEGLRTALTVERVKVLEQAAEVQIEKDRGGYWQRQFVETAGRLVLIEINQGVVCYCTKTISTGLDRLASTAASDTRGVCKKPIPATDEREETKS